MQAPRCLSNMIAKSRKLYDEFREPRMLRLRRSSGNEQLETKYITTYNIEEHILYRKQELASIYQTYQYCKYGEKIMEWLGSKCSAYTEESIYDMLGCYLIGESNVEKKADSRKIMEYRLNLKDKNQGKDNIYASHCINLLDHYSYLILLNL